MTFFGSFTGFFAADALHAHGDADRTGDMGTSPSARATLECPHGEVHHWNTLVVDSGTAVASGWRRDKRPAMPKQDSIPGLSQLLKCPICLGLLSVACDTNCGHAFCAPCILQHLKHSARCPLCREEITSAHPSFVLRTMVETYRSARHGTNSAPAKDGKADVDTAEKGVGESLGPLPPGLGSTLRHSASMSSMSSLNSNDDDRYDTLLREHTAATRMGYTGGVNESSLLLNSNGSAARGEASRAGLASQWLLAHKPIMFVIGCVAVFFLVALIIVLMQWSCVLPSPVPASQ